MTKTLILIALIILIYLYWKSQQKPSLKTKPEFSEEIFFDAPSDSENELPKVRKDWFADKHWLTDTEIDWALEQVIKQLPAEQANYKVLEATQFMFAKESMETKDVDARDSFPILLSGLTGTDKELFFIPVNNPNFHWSLLVYEVKSKKFYHFDTLKGANDNYVRPLVKELLSQIHQTNQPNLKDYFQTRYHLSQGNSLDCGIAVIEIAKAVMKDYPTYQRILLYTKLDFDFPAARKNWHQRLNNYA